MKGPAAYRCFRIPRYFVNAWVGDRFEWAEVPAQVICFSVPWIHPRLRRRIHRKGRR